MSLFSRMFGTTEKGEPPAPSEPEQGGEMAQWPYATLPIPRVGDAPVRRASVPPPIPPPHKRAAYAGAPAQAGQQQRSETATADASASSASSTSAVAPTSPARAPVNAVRALQTIVIRAPAPASPSSPPVAENDQINLALEWLASTLPTRSKARPVADDQAAKLAKRDPLLVQSLLRQVPDVHQLTIDKLRAAGYGSLEALCRASAADLVAFGRIDPARADAIARRLRRYSREQSARSREQVQPKLRALLERLTRAHADYERADAADERAKKRSARDERRAASLELSVLLAQLGETELVEGLERSSTEYKIESVRRYLAGPSEPAVVHKERT